ncbi:MAG: MFS transporter [Gammaproteobacteria bacterium]|nr:MFS transporter [Gammaproteobacteria bacterium]
MNSLVASLQVYCQKRILAMLALGFSAGLPLLLVFGTLSFWLRKEGIDRATIGFISWVALFYGLKFLWAPLVDHLRLPLLSRLLGQRRSWLLLAQLGVLLSLFAMGSVNPQDNLQHLVLLALVVAFSSATQDIALDAWRIESAPIEQQAAMAASYQLGYRLGMILAGGGAFTLAHFYGWSIAYQVMAGFMLIGVVTSLLVSEPTRAVISANTSASRLQRSSQWLLTAVVKPFADFFYRNGYFGLVLLLFIGCFRLSDITMGVMAGPFYVDMGYTELQVGLVSKTFGVGMTIFGALLGGLLVTRFKILPMLVISSILVVITNLIFAILATKAPTTLLLASVITADNISGGIAGTVFIAYLSGLTNRLYTATQYALLSSVMLLPAKFMGGFAGEVVDALGYLMFFIYSAGLGLPAILLALWLSHRQ